ncbi:MAG: GIY-YIG nuclease family protein [Bacteroidetes bacterium]|nr:GIY-YIG nuclease family protein [Bacteroidota bacterium]
MSTSTSKGRTTFPDTRKRSGIYIIKENDKIVYVGSSRTNLYRTLYRHFEHWKHRTQEVVTYVNKMNRQRYTVRIVLCTAVQAIRLERALVIRHKPRDNENKFKQYTLDVIDKRTLKTYEEISLYSVAPF